MEKRRHRRVNVDLDGVIEFQNKERAKCSIYNISERCAGVMLSTLNPNVCEKQNVKLSIFIPAESEPVECSGDIIWYIEDKDPARIGKIYLAGISVTDINRIDQRRIELIVGQMRSYFNG
jgi:hypothetical protein